MKEVPSAKDWAERWRSHGINSGQEEKELIATVLGSPPVQLSDCPCTDLGLSKGGKQAALLASVTKYAGAVRSLRLRAGLETCLAAFQELVFVSLCNVLLHHGFSEDDINTVMRWKNISNSSSKSLKRLRSRALWVNRLINQLSWQGCGDPQLTQHLFIRLTNCLDIGGRGIKQYGRFADSAQIYNYFVTRLSTWKYTTDFVPTSGWIPFSNTPSYTEPGRESFDVCLTRFNLVK